MFFVFNKQKIYTYAVSLVTVIVLFFVASNFGQENQKTIETSAENQKLLPIYNVQTEENKVRILKNPIVYSISNTEIRKTKEERMMFMRKKMTALVMSLAMMATLCAGCGDP